MNVLEVVSFQRISPFATYILTEHWDPPYSSFYEDPLLANAASTDMAGI